MNSGISIRKRENYVHSEVRGALTIELLAELMTEITARAEDWRLTKHLIDMCEAQKQMGVSEDYDLAYKKAAGYGLKTGSRYAVLVKQAYKNEFVFVETVFQNAGYDVRIFTEEEAALAWIRK